MTRLEELCWGCDTVIHFTVSAVTVRVFDLDGKVNVLHIRTEVNVLHIRT